MIAAVAGSSQSSETASHESGECATQQVAERDQPTVMEAIAIDSSICHACDFVIYASRLPENAAVSQA